MLAAPGLVTLDDAGEAAALRRADDVDELARLAGRSSPGNTGRVPKENARGKLPRALRGSETRS
jgi:hypothetical protein